MLSICKFKSGFLRMHFHAGIAAYIGGIRNKADKKLKLPDSMKF